MRLTSFQVTNYRSVRDSGLIKVEQITSLLGRNESGKSNLLRALHSLNPAEGFERLSPIKDFPRDQPLGECTDETIVLRTQWVLEESEREELTQIWPRAIASETINVLRAYGTTRSIGIPKHDLELAEKEVTSKLKKVVAALGALVDGMPDDDPKKEKLSQSAVEFAGTTQRETGSVRDWATRIVDGTASIRKALAASDQDLTQSKKRTSLTSRILRTLL